MKIAIVILFLGTGLLYSCGGASAPSAVPGAGGKQLYEIMDEDSTEVKADSIAPSAP